MLGGNGGSVLCPQSQPALEEHRERVVGDVDRVGVIHPWEISSGNPRSCASATAATLAAVLLAAPETAPSSTIETIAVVPDVGGFVRVAVTGQELCLVRGRHAVARPHVRPRSRRSCLARLALRRKVSRTS